MDSTGTSLGGVLGTAGNIYGSVLGAQNQNNLSNAANTGFNMAQGAYNPSLYGMNGVGGTGFSVSSPNGGPGSINTSLGTMQPGYNNNMNVSQMFAGAGAQDLNNPLIGQANNASSSLIAGAAGGSNAAYQNALAATIPQLQNMQNNQMAAGLNSEFQRGQLGAGSFGQAGAGANPTNLQTSSLAQGFGQADLNAITSAQNMGLNYMNTDLSGANTMANIGLGQQGMATNLANAGIGNFNNTATSQIQNQNALGQLPLAYASLQGNQQIGATNANANTIRASNVNGNALSSGTAGLLQSLLGGSSSLLGGSSSGSSPLSNLINSGSNYLNGGSSAGSYLSAGTADSQAGSLINSGVTSDLGGYGGDTLLGSDIGDISAAGDATDATDLSGILGSFGSAGGQAAATGLSADAADAEASSLIASSTPDIAAGVGASADVTGGAAASGLGAAAGLGAFGAAVGVMDIAAPAIESGLNSLMGIGNDPITQAQWNTMTPTERGLAMDPTANSPFNINNINGSDLNNAIAKYGNANGLIFNG
jgi:hypothetical protein